MFAVSDKGMLDSYFFNKYPSKVFDDSLFPDEAIVESGIANETAKTV